MAFLALGIGVARVLTNDSGDPAISGNDQTAGTPTAKISFDTVTKSKAWKSSYKFDLSANGNAAALPAMRPNAAGEITVFQGRFRMGTLATVGLMSVASTQDAARVLRTDASGNIELLDKTGTQLKVSSGSNHLVAATWHQITFLVDRGVALGGDVTWVALVVDGVEWWSGNIGNFTTNWDDSNSWAWGEWMAAGASRGANGIFNAESLSARRSTTSSDLPWTTAYPVFESRCAFPISDTTDHAWVKTGGGAASGTYTMWNEAGANDGDTSENHATAQNQTQLSYMDLPSSMGVGGSDIIDYVTHASVIKAAAAGKSFGAGAIGGDLGTTAEQVAIANPGTSYRFQIVQFTSAATAAGSTTLVAGWTETGTDTFPTCTKLILDVVSHASTIAVGAWTNPVSTGRRRFAGAVI